MSSLSYYQYTTGELPPEIQIGAQNADQHDCRAGYFFPAPTRPGFGFVFGSDSLKRKAANASIVGFGSHMADPHHYNRRNDGDQYAEILEVDVVDNPQE